MSAKEVFLLISAKNSSLVCKIQLYDAKNTGSAITLLLFNYRLILLFIVTH